MIRASLSLALLALGAAAPASAQWTTTSLSTPRTTVAAVTVGQWVLFAGGRDGSTVSDRVDAYDSLTGTWSTASLSLPRAQIAATVVGDLALFASGAVSAFTSTDRVDVYDASVGPPSLPAAWSTYALTEAKFAAAATSVGTKALFAGGAFGGPASPTGQSALVDVYDAALGGPSDAAAWSTTSLSVARAQIAAVTAGDKACFAGGLSLPGNVHDTVDVYDDASGTWSTSALSEARMVGAGACCAIGSRAYFAGGAISAMPALMSDRVDVYDAASGTWSTASLSQPRFLIAATAVGERALFAGGLTASNQPSDVVDVHEAAQGTWSATALSVARVEPAAASVGGRALIGGGGTSGGAASIVDVYDNTVGTSYCGPAVPSSTGAPASLVAQGFPGAAAQGYLLLSAEQLPQQSFGFFICSRTQGLTVSAGIGVGTLCLGGAIGRYVGPGQVKNSRTAGHFQLLLDLSSTPMPNGLVQVQAGETWNFQAWFRDSLAGAATSNFTDAVSVDFL